MCGSLCVYLALRWCQSGTQPHVCGATHLDLIAISKAPTVWPKEASPHIRGIKLTPSKLPSVSPRVSTKAPHQEPDVQSLTPAWIRIDGDLISANLGPSISSGWSTGFQHHRFSLHPPRFKASLVTETHSETCNVNRGTSTKNPGKFSLNPGGLLTPLFENTLATGKLVKLDASLDLATNVQGPSVYEKVKKTTLLSPHLALAAF